MSPEYTDNPKGKKGKFDTRRFQKDAAASRDALKPFRDFRIEALRQYAGGRYSTNAADKDVPVNLIKLGVDTYKTTFLSGTPQVTVAAKRGQTQLKPYAKTMQIAVNQLLLEMRLDDLLQDCVAEALFCMGVMKTGVCDDVTAYLDGETMTVGRPYCEPISLDDYIVDMSVNDVREACFEGHRYETALDAAKERFSGKDELLKAKSYTGTNEKGAAKDRLDVSESEYESEFGYAPKLDLWEIYFQFDGKLRTFTTNDEGGVGDLLEEVEYVGPRGGPYTRLYFEKLLNSLMPIAPVMNWMPLHEAYNDIMRKTNRQARNTKTFVAVAQGGEDDGNRAVRVNDGDVYRFDHPEKIKSHTLGGVNPDLVTYGSSIFEAWNLLANNVMALAGLGPQADTLGQDQLLHDAANKIVQRMQAQVLNFVTQVVRKLIWYLWQDPLLEVYVEKNAAGLPIPTVWGPNERQGDFMDYNIDVQPYSLQPLTPAQQLQGIERYMGGFVAPYMEMIMQQGGSVNMEKLSAIYAELTNIPAIQDVLQWTSLPQTIEEPSLAPGERANTAAGPNKKRQYERISRSAGDNMSPMARLSGQLGKTQPGATSHAPAAS